MSRPPRRERFNPHPPLLAGETNVAVHVERHFGVSIHTRHYWRVKRPHSLAIHHAFDVSIHTRHYWRVKQASKVEKPAPSCFNPHPPLLAGETQDADARWAGQNSFNPHPPLLAGETRLPSMHYTDTTVSIHTRHYWRVKRRGL